MLDRMLRPSSRPRPPFKRRKWLDQGSTSTAARRIALVALEPSHGTATKVGLGEIRNCKNAKTTASHQMDCRALASEHHQKSALLAIYHVFRSLFPKPLHPTPIAPTMKNRYATRARQYTFPSRHTLPLISPPGTTTTRAQYLHSQSANKEVSSTKTGRLYSTLSSVARRSGLSVTHRHYSNIMPESESAPSISGTSAANSTTPASISTPSVTATTSSTSSSPSSPSIPRTYVKKSSKTSRPTLGTLRHIPDTACLTSQQQEWKDQQISTMQAQLQNQCFIETQKTIGLTVQETPCGRSDLHELLLVNQFCRIQRGRTLRLPDWHNQLASRMAPVESFLHESGKQHAATVELLMFNQTSDPKLDLIMENAMSIGIASFPLSTPAAEAPVKTAYNFPHGLDPIFDAILSLRLFPSSVKQRLLQQNSEANLRLFGLDYLLLTKRHYTFALQWLQTWRKRDPMDYDQTEFGNRIDEILASAPVESRDKCAMTLARMKVNSDADWIFEAWKRTERLSAPQYSLPDYTVAEADSDRNLPLQALLRMSSAELADPLEAQSRVEILARWIRASWDTRLLDLWNKKDEDMLPHLLRPLWREMAIVGILASDLSPVDVRTSIPHYLKERQFRTSLDDPVMELEASKLIQDPLEAFLHTCINKSDAISQANNNASAIAAGLLLRAISEIKAPDNNLPISVRQMKAYQELLLNVAHRTAARMNHRGLYSTIAQARFSALYGKGVHGIGPRTITTATGSEIGWFAREFVHSDLAKFVAFDRIQPITSNVLPVSGLYSDWMKTTMGKDNVSGMLMDMAHKSRISNQDETMSLTAGYDVALKTLIRAQEFDLALNLHRMLYLNLLPASGAEVIHRKKKNKTRPFTSRSISSKIQQQPSRKELHMLVSALANSKGLEGMMQAQELVDDHLRLYSQSQNLGLPDTPPYMDIQLITVLASGWAKRAEFLKMRDAIELMNTFQIRANMVFYNSCLKALTDLLPSKGSELSTTLRLSDEMMEGASSKNRIRGSGLFGRELARELVVKERIKSTGLSGSSGPNQDSAEAGTQHQPTPGLGKVMKEDDIAAYEHRRLSSSSTSSHGLSDLDQAWGSFLRIILSQSGVANIHVLRHIIPESIQHSIEPRTFSLSPSTSSFSSPTIQNAHTNATTFFGSEESFQPDLYTYSILIHTIARRQDIRPIQDLFVDMRSRGLEPDGYIYSGLADAFAKKGDLNAVAQVTLEARKRGAEPGMYMRNIALNGLVDTNASVDRVREAVADMIRLGEWEEAKRREEEQQYKNKGLGIDVGDDEVAEGKTVETARLTMNDRVSSPLKSLSPGLDAVGLSTLVKYHSQRGDRRSALQVLESMGKEVNLQSLTPLIASYIRHQDTVSAVGLLRLLREQAKDLQPDSKIWKGLLRCAMDQDVEELKKRNELQNHWFYSRSRILDDQESGSGAMVMDVLEELFATVQAVNRNHAELARVVMTKKDGGNNPGKEYLMEVLKSSWISTSAAKDKDNRRRIVNSSFKGPNGLLRRLVNHFFWTPEPVPIENDKWRLEDDKQQSRQQHWPTDDQVRNQCRKMVWVLHNVQTVGGIELGQVWIYVTLRNVLQTKMRWSKDQIEEVLGPYPEMKNRKK